MQSVPAFSSLICWGRIRLWWGHWPYLCLPELVALAHGVIYRTPPGSLLVERLHESRFGSFKRLLGSHLFFWSMAREVGRLPLLRFRWWRSQSRTRVMTTASPVSAARLDLPEPREIAAIALDRFSGREQS